MDQHQSPNKQSFGELSSSLAWNAKKCVCSVSAKAKFSLSPLHLPVLSSWGRQYFLILAVSVCSLLSSHILNISRLIKCTIQSGCSYPTQYFLVASLTSHVHITHSYIAFTCHGPWEHHIPPRLGPSHSVLSHHVQLNTLPPSRSVTSYPTKWHLHSMAKVKLLIKKIENCPCN